MYVISVSEDIRNLRVREPIEGEMSAMDVPAAQTETGA